MKNSRALGTLLTVVCAVIMTTSTFAQLDVPRRTTAITYPLDELVMVQFRGTTRFPRMKGEAKIKRTSRNGTEIELTVSKMPRPFELGAGYATYVLWAVSPEGHADNLGEIKRRGFFEFDSKISVTTKLQTFALIITAEPHFLVARPSQEIMLENLSPYSASGTKIATVAAVQYFGNSSDYFRDARTPEIAELDYSKTPSAVLQAKQAVALARFAGAERDAPEEYKEAESLLVSAENQWKAGRDDEAVDVAARAAISAGVKAESTAYVRKDAREKRNEKLRADAETRQAENRMADAQSEIAELKRQLQEEIRLRELAERDVKTYSDQNRDLRSENGRLREDLVRARVEADNAKSKIESIENAQRAAEEQKNKEQRMGTLSAGQPAFMQTLRRFGAVSKNERGIVLTLPETYWSATRSSSFSPTADPKLSSLGEVLANNPDYRVVIEAHTDDKGTPEELSSLTEQRARLIADRLSGFGVTNTRIEVKGMGATLPVAPNTTNANRAKNRRVNLILVPNI